jgi:hypothetical protein
MDTLKKNLEQREKPELIAIIHQMLRQEPELLWLLMTPLPSASSRKSSVAPGQRLRAVWLVIDLLRNTLNMPA